MTHSSTAILPITFRASIVAENTEALVCTHGMHRNQRLAQIAGFLSGPRFLLSAWAVDHASHRDHSWRMRCLAAPIDFKSPMLCFEQAGAFPILSFIASHDSILAVDSDSKLHSDWLNARLDAAMAAHHEAFDHEIAHSGLLWTPWREARIEYNSGRPTSKRRDMHELNELDEWRDPDLSLMHAIDARAFTLIERIELSKDIPLQTPATLRPDSI